MHWRSTRLARYGSIDRGSPNFAIVERVVAIPETDLARVRRCCEQRVPAHLRHELRVELELRGHLLTIVETPPPWRPDYGPQWSRSPTARLRYAACDGPWTLYWRELEGFTLGSFVVIALIGVVLCAYRV